MNEFSIEFTPEQLALDEFTKAYITAMYFTEEEELRNKNVNDLAPESLAQIVQECKQFQEQNESALAGLDSEQCGHDFWLTRNRHGAGFWDRGYGDIGRQLTEAAHAWGEMYVYVDDDGQVYHD